jgi:cell division protein FtsB
MTDTRSAAQIFADIFGPAPTERERSLIVRVALLENDILELEAANETLQRQNLELIDRIKTLKGRL